MARVLTNNTAVAYAKEDSRGVLPGSPTWKSLEPNGINTLGNEITTVARSPISKNRQNRKGTVVDLASGFEYEADATLDVLLDFMEGFCFATATNQDLTFQGADHTGTAYTIPAATAAQAAKIQWVSGGEATLVYASGYVNSGNNGIFAVTADTASSGTAITTGTGTAETAPANAEVSVCGIRAEDGDLALTVSGATGTLSSGNGTASSNIDFTTLGLTVGQRIHVGGLTDANRFGSTAAGDGTRSYGSARITAIAAGSLTLDKLDSTLVASDGTDDGSGGTEQPVDLLFGRFIRNVAVDDSSFLEQYFQFEVESPNLFETDPPTPVAEPDGYEYAIGNLSNEAAWSFGLNDKATITVGFVGQETEDPVDGGSRKTNAASPIEPLFTGAFNTSSDFARLRIEDTDESGLVTDFKDLTVTLSNNVSPENILGTLGAAYINYGNFDVTISGSALFTEANVPARIRSNTTVSMDWLLQNDDGAVAVDIPSMTLSSDGREYPVNETVQIGLSGTAFQDSALGTSIGISFFPVYPTS